MPEPLSVILLAGGKGSRIGLDKPFLGYQGELLILRLARRVLPIAAELIFSANDVDQYAALAWVLRGTVPVRAVADNYPNAGPLAGLEAGLFAARHDLALLLAADMPFVSLPLLEYMRGLAAEYDVVVPRVPDPQTGDVSHEPLHAFYRRSCLPAIAHQLAAGRRRVISFLSEVRVREVPPEEAAQFDPEGLSYFNINTPGDWERAQRLLDAAEMVRKIMPENRQPETDWGPDVGEEAS